jgi:hypothetical protein
MDSFDYVTEMIYDGNGNLKTPSRMNNLYYEIQTLVYLTQNNPEWPDLVKQDIMEYVENCTNLLEKM